MVSLTDKLSKLQRENTRFRSALYVIAYADAKPCEDMPEEIALKTLEEDADYSSFLPSPPITAETVEAMEDILAVSAKVPFKPFPSSEKQ